MDMTNWLAPSHDRPRGVTILGSTGSVGQSTVDLIARDPDSYRVEALVAGNSVEALAEQAALQAVSRQGSKSQAELIDGRLRHLALGKLLPRAGSGRTRQLFAEIGSGHLVHLQQRLPQSGVAPGGIVSTAFALFRQREAELLSEHPHRVLKAHFLVKLEELEDITADAASEAVKEAFLGVDVK